MSRPFVFNQNYLFDGDTGFIGLNSRDNPQSLEKGNVTKSQNFRLNRGIATVRKGNKRLTAGAILGKTLRFATTFRTSAGIDLFVFITDNSIVTWNPKTNQYPDNVLFPFTNGVQETISETDEVDAFQAGGALYILRGLNKTTLKWGGGLSIEVQTGTQSQFPKSPHGIYNANRAIVQSSADEISVSHYLDLTHFELLDVFKINDGSNEEIKAIAPWLLNEFVVFMRNRMYYASVGSGAKASGDSPVSADSYVKVMATDIGCSARRSIVQAAGGMIFLSDFGVYMMQPSSATTPEGMRAGILGDPISAPIEDVILRINQDAISKACAAYYDNRYYLAVPVDGSTTNNVVLVYNFINKAWESVDTFKTGMDVSFMLTGIYNNKKRLFYVDKDFGLFLAEELDDGDEYDVTKDSAVLPLPLPFKLDKLNFRKYSIDGIIITRSYNFGFSEDKRYSQVEIDVIANAGAQLTTSIITENPDTTTFIETFGSPGNEDGTRDLPIRKIASSALIKFETAFGRPSLKSLFLTALRTGNNIRSSN